VEHEHPADSLTGEGDASAAPVEGQDRVNILIVDDRPEQLLVLE